MGIKQELWTAYRSSLASVFKLPCGTERDTLAKNATTAPTPKLLSIFCFNPRAREERDCSKVTH